MSGRRGMFKLPNCLLACWHVLIWSSEMSTDFFAMHYAQIAVVYVAAC